MRILVALVFALSTTGPSLAQTAVNGDTIELDGVMYRLGGIDAPDIEQICTDGWRAGVAAVERLAELIRDRPVTCEVAMSDPQGMVVATCHAGGADLAAEMVEAGLALAVTRFNGAYAPQEARARLSDRGLHAHGCLAPWIWRARRLAALKAGRDWRTPAAIPDLPLI